MIAAPGLKALDNVDRLADDHANAERLAAGLDALDGVDAPAPDTNIVVAHTEAAGIEAADLVTACKGAGVGCVEFDDYTTRFTTHLDVDADDVAPRRRRRRRRRRSRPDRGGRGRPARLTRTAVSTFGPVGPRRTTETFNSPGCLQGVWT